MGSWTTRNGSAAIGFALCAMGCAAVPARQPARANIELDAQSDRGIAEWDANQSLLEAHDDSLSARTDTALPSDAEAAHAQQLCKRIAHAALIAYYEENPLPFGRKMDRCNCDLACDVDHCATIPGAICADSFHPNTQRAAIEYMIDTCGEMCKHANFGQPNTCCPEMISF